MERVFKKLQIIGILNYNFDLSQTFKDVDSIVKNNLETNVKALLITSGESSGEIFSKDIHNGFGLDEKDIVYLPDEDLDVKREKYLFTVRKELEFEDGDYNLTIKFLIKNDNVFS